MGAFFVSRSAHHNVPLLARFLLSEVSQNRPKISAINAPI
nr:MAG TPA: hypothetical protein [Caudoviricetes sp.]